MSGTLPRWLVIFLVVDAILLAGVIGWLVMSGQADVPCQDGTWDAAAGTCVPDPAALP